MPAFATCFFLAIFQKVRGPKDRDLPGTRTEVKKNNSVAMFSFWIQVLQCLDGKTCFIFRIKRKHTFIYIRTWAGCTFRGPWRPIIVLDFSYHVKTHWAPLLKYSATMRFAHIWVNDYICLQHLGNMQFTFAFQILKNKEQGLYTRWNGFENIVFVAFYGRILWASRCL